MNKMKKNFGATQLAVFLSLALIFALFFGCDATAPGGCNPQPTTDLLPVVFVHGMAGSADQFSLQAQRFASNGYPADLISGVEYDTTMANNTYRQVMEIMDAHIDKVLAQTGADQVNLVGHSMGTMMSVRYLTSKKARAAKVAHYVNVDGTIANQAPGGVPTLAIWAALTGEGRSFTGATNVTLPAQTHVQACTSAETFAEMYKFFNGEEPDTVDVVPEAPGATVTIAGKLTTFLTNANPQNYKIDIYEVNPQTGMRTSTEPAYSQDIDPDGSFKFTNAVVGKKYEFATHSDDDPDMTQHFYYEALIRSNLLMRFKIAEPGSALAKLLETSADQANLTIVRDKELVGNAEDRPNQTLLKNDSLTVNGIELCSPESAPILNATIGLELYDAGTDGQSDVTKNINKFASIPFIGGIDLYLQGETPPQDTISVVLNGRQNGGLTQEINVPNWSSATDKITVQFRPF